MTASPSEDPVGRPLSPPDQLVMGVLAEVLELATARMTVSQVLDLAGREPVRRRFRLGDEDLARTEQWVRESNVRPVGFDAAHRQAFKLGLF